jgi:WD40 repeat protein
MVRTCIPSQVTQMAYNNALAVRPDGSVFSGSRDGTIEVLCGVNGAHLHTLRSLSEVLYLAFAPDGNLFSGGINATPLTRHVLQCGRTCLEVW